LFEIPTGKSVGPQFTTHEISFGVRMAVLDFHSKTATVEFLECLTLRGRLKVFSIQNIAFRMGSDKLFSCILFKTETLGSKQESRDFCDDLFFLFHAYSPSLKRINE
jgi:hypothetical protein